MGEFELIRKYFSRGLRTTTAGVRLGIGDDCALLDTAGTLAVTTDMLVEGRHFFADVDPRALGHKALAVNLSDLAAMGAAPFAFTLALALPITRAADDRWLKAFATGVFELADQHGCELVGGDTTAGPLTINITAMGRVAPALALRRSAAVVGDDIYVSGTLGDAALAVRALSGQVLVDDNTLSRVRTALEWPQPQVQLGRALGGLAHAAVDVSDGLAGDLGHVLAASGVGAVLNFAQIPRSADVLACDETVQWHCVLHGGDDYQLCFAAPVEHRDAIAAIAERIGVSVSRVGAIVGTTGLRVAYQGDERHVTPRGYDHFV